MDISRIETALTRLFDEEHHRLIFWNDPGGEFTEILPALALSGVTTLRLDQEAAFGVKLRVERQDTSGKYLLYSPTEEPEPEDDWLLDIRLYGKQFRADRASMLLDELGLVSQSLRGYLAERRKFFENKDRLARFKQLVSPADTEADLDRKMLAVVLKADPPDFYQLLQTLCAAVAETQPVDLTTPPPAWEQIVKFGLDQPFWNLIEQQFGYREETPSIQNLLIRLFVSDFVCSLRGCDAPPQLKNLMLPDHFLASGSVFLNLWSDSLSKSASYDLISAEIARLIKLDSFLHLFELKHLTQVTAFLTIEKAIASRLRQRVIDTKDTINAQEIRAIATQRQTGHWVNLSLQDSQPVPRRALHAVYEALMVAAEFLALRNQYQNGFQFDDAAGMFRGYEKELYRFDQLYRLFCEQAEQAELKGWDILKNDLRQTIEDSYRTWYLTRLGLTWGKFLEGGLLADWRLTGVPNQFQFYKQFVQTRLDEADNRKVFVIISDAFRYEAAQELLGMLNGKYRFSAELGSVLGVLPSYTALGMASLLPHKQLEYRGESKDVLADGRSTASGNRDTVLQSVGGMACQADDLLKLKKEDGRTLVNGKRVVYIYHNVVDARGDTASTESETFQAVRQAINELAELVNYVINNLNGNYVVVTADHGFLYTDTAPGEPEKSKLDEKPDGTILAKKRYLLGRNLPGNEAVFKGSTLTTAQAAGGMEFWIPKSINRFHFTGGARFVHGGAMPQEIVVPVLVVRQIKGKSVSETKTRPVSVTLLGENHRITTTKHRFAFIQVEAVSERIKPARLKIAIYDGDRPITNVETVLFGSSSASIEERKQFIWLTLSDQTTDKKKTYKLLARDAETGIEQFSAQVIIDRTFTEDF